MIRLVRLMMHTPVTCSTHWQVAVSSAFESEEIEGSHDFLNGECTYISQLEGIHFKLALTCHAFMVQVIDRRIDAPSVTSLERSGVRGKYVGQARA
jgi:hypothetical protein